MRPFLCNIGIICGLALFCSAEKIKKPTPSTVCSDFSSILPTENVLFPDDAAYNSTTASYWFVNQKIQKPTCIVKPRNAANVSSVIKLLRKAPNVKFAIKSGGHAMNAEFSNIDGGITVDLSLLNDVKVQNDGITVSIGTGATWGDVYPVLDARGRSLNGGRSESTGVGGFLSGGGIGFFARKEGFACDAVANMQVVLSTGEIINANANSNKDLFVALKGGQSNFGIITRFDIATIPVGQVWGGSVLFPETTTSEQLDAFTRWKLSPNFDPHSSIEQSYVYAGALGIKAISVSAFYAKPQPYPADLQPFTSIQPQLTNILRLTNVSDLATEIQAQNPPNQYTVWAPTTFKISPTILTKVHAVWSKAVTQMTRNNATILSSMTLQSIPAAPPQNDPSRQNSLGFKPGSMPEKDLVLAHISTYWEDPAFSQQIVDASKEFVESVEREAKREGVYHPFVYENYAAAWQDPLKSTGNLEQLRKVARKYDKEGMFTRQVVGGFKLW
ncbi:bifunctional solanapyrone synthase [Naviculisporaceae sp. PSN 640]